MGEKQKKEKKYQTLFGDSRLKNKSNCLNDT